MLTFDQAQDDGYVFADGDGSCTVSRDDVTLAVFTSDCPRFFALRYVASLEDDELATADITADLISQTSGETYTEPETVDPVATADDHASITAAIITAQLAEIPMTLSELQASLQTLLTEASETIPFLEQYALDPSMESEQWTAFQALYTNDLTQFLRLMYDVIRICGMLLRYQIGSLPAAAS